MKLASASKSQWNQLGSCKMFVKFYGLYKNVFHTKGDATISTIMVAHNHLPASIMSIVIQEKNN
jgi:hypothetical protein